MRIINSLDELAIPSRHKIYLEHLLNYFREYPQIERVLLFGSCAKGEATLKSDIDLFLLGTDMTDEDEWNIVWNCPNWDGVEHVACDILSGTHDEYDRMSRVPGMVQCAVEMKGIDLSKLLRS